VYVPASAAILQNTVTDPYSPDLALNGTKTRLTDLSDPSTKPDSWDVSTSPALDSPNDFSAYELHVREFSSADTSVPPEYRGTYLAFTANNSAGMNHLQQLSQAGLNAIHLLPTFHFGSVNEDKSTWQYPAGLTPNPPDGQAQQAAVAQVKSFDAYNWGYDPVHYFAPQGSYAFNPGDRVKEYRQMVQSLHNIGLRVVQDIVFNHTVSSGQAGNSVLDKIVPNYYYRLDADGTIYTASCCPDTASEHRMMEKLMIDNLVQNATQYKIDGFRFDLMGFHFVYNLLHIQQALSGLTISNDGVDGSQIYLYGEGWETGETAHNALGPNCSQGNMYGTGIGTFNDRMRDGVRGGGPFADMRLQGFATGLFTEPSAFTSQNQSLSDQANLVTLQADWLRVSLAGNLRDFTFVNNQNQQVRGADIIYNGQPAGYTAAPIEAVNYCSVHDNQTLFDAIQLKSPIPGTTSTGGDSIAMRTRRQVLAISLVALGQGIPFFLAGDDLLRSKDMDHNSYDSGDWFNQIDWTGASANWGIGLPIASENQSSWPLMQPLLADPALAPTPANIVSCSAAFKAFLGIRSSSRLFRMQTLTEVQNNLQFLNTGTGQTPGLIVMKLAANGGNYGVYKHILVVFNSAVAPVSFQDDQLRDLGLQLHPLQLALGDAQTQAEVDPISGTVMVSALTTAVFVS
jgi:pullulanase